MKDGHKNCYFEKSEIYTPTVIHSLKHVYEKTNQKYCYQHVLEQAFRIFKSQKAIGHFLLRCGGQYPLSSVHTFYFLFKQTLKVNR